MTNKLPWFIDAEAFKRFRSEINKENRIAISLLAIGGLPVSAGVLISQLVVAGSGAAYSSSFLLIAYFLLMVLFDRRLLPRDYPRSTALLYLLEAPVMLLAVLLGTVLDPVNPANTVLLFTMLMPAFILDYPWRSLLVQGGWSLLFMALCIAVKPRALWPGDGAHIFVFYLGASVMTNVLLHIRMDSLRHLEEASYRLEHDGHTGCLNRYALQSRTPLYLNRSLTILLADLDQFMLFNDLYGADTGEAIMGHLTRTLSECFGHENIYHHQGDEFLCVMDGVDEAACLTAIAHCREKLGNYMQDGHRLNLTCAFGYATGTPTNEQTFNEMIQLADIYAHAAKKTGPNATKGSAYSQVRLREGIIESNMSTHARAYQINSLTGLPGMSYFVTRSDALLSSIVDMSRHPVIGCFKLMHLREFNATFNYSGGDALIADTAKLLRNAFSGRYVCHITAAKFGIMCYEDEVAPGMEKIIAALKVYKPDFPVQCRAGFAWFTGGESTISLMDKARLAQKTILEDDETDYCFYDSYIDEQIKFEQYITSHVDEAIEKGWLRVYYQPIIRAVTGYVCNEEALSRWDDPTYGFLQPYRFIPLLEANDQIYKVSLHVVAQVLRDFKRKEAEGVPIVPISINLSRKDLKQHDMVEAITDLVDESGYSHDLIKIEITESAFIQDQALISREVTRFREAGFDVWLDDFGSEYSTLNLLQEIDFNLIKIDMQFMKNLSVTGKNFIIVSSIISMAHRMGIVTLIEGVETEEQFAIMRQLGCEKVQGFLFNCPNHLDYIVKRVHSKKGLIFEKPSDVPYYEAVGQVDLESPLSRDETQLLADTHMTVGILEYRDNAFTALRMTERFRRTLEQWGAIDPEEDTGIVSVKPVRLPNALSEALVRSEHASDWLNHDLQFGADRYTVFIRPVATRQGGGVAMLTVLLKNRD